MSKKEEETQRRADPLFRKKSSTVGTQETESETDCESSSFCFTPQAPPKRKSSLKTANVQEQKRRHSLPETTTRKRVSFSTIDIREYERTLSDNPSVSSGPAIGIGWNYTKLATLELQAYEENKGPPRKGVALQIPRELREEWLRESGVSRQELIKAVRGVNIDKRSRRSTVATVGEMEGLHIVMESAARKLKRLVRLEPSTKKQQEKLWKNAAKHNGGVRRRATWSGPIPESTLATVNTVKERRISADNDDEESA